SGQSNVAASNAFGRNTGGRRFTKSTRPFTATRRTAMKFVYCKAELGLLVGCILVSTSGIAVGQTTRVSVDSNGNQGNAGSFLSALSADARFVAFDSSATTLVTGDTNGFSDIFVRDRATGQTTRVSVDSSGTQANDDSFNPAISANGRFVAFASRASNLVAGDTNASGFPESDFDTFVHDRLTGQTVRVNVDSAGQQANATDFPQSPSLSADGRFVAFSSFASNLVAGDTN